MRLDEVITQSIDRWPDRVAVVHKGRSWTSADLSLQTSMVANMLSEAGLSQGHRAVLWAENSFDYIVTYLAILRVGAVVVAIHPQTLVSEVARIIRHVAATAMIISPSIKQWSLHDFASTGLVFVVREGQVVSCDGAEGRSEGPEGLAQIIYTSGSTGQPKGVMLTHQNLIANTTSILDYLQLTPEDSVMAVLPFTYAYGNSVMLTHLVAGGALVIENSFLYPHVILDAMMREGVTGFSGVSTSYAVLLNQSNLQTYSFPKLRYLTHAGGPMPCNLLGRVRSAFPGKQIYLMYGQTEASARLTYLPPDLLDTKKGSAGRAIPGVTLKIVKSGGETAQPGELGEVWALGDNIMLGYWQDAGGTAEALCDGWLRTGDLGRLDKDGYLTIEGRNSEMIKCGAYRISPTEIEEALLQHPAVQEAGVVGVEDPILGQKICAFVTLKKGTTATDQELLAHCAQRLVQYKRPKSVTVTASLPKSPSGKILRHRLRELTVASPLSTVHSKA